MSFCGSKKIHGINRFMRARLKNKTKFPARKKNSQYVPANLTLPRRLKVFGVQYAIAHDMIGLSELFATYLRELKRKSS